MADFNTFFGRVLGRANQTATVFRKDGSEVSFDEDGTVTVKAKGNFTFEGLNTRIEERATALRALTLNDYQDGAISTAIYKDEYKVIYPALKLAGEAGEVAEKVGKNLRDGDGTYTPEFKKELRKELGDVLWYIAALARDIDSSLEELAQENLDKLASRKARGVLGGSGDNR